MVKDIPNIINHLLGITGKKPSQLAVELGISRARINKLKKSCTKLDIDLNKRIRDYCSNIGIDADKFWLGK